MLISTKGRYALRVMTDLAEHQDEGFIPLKVIAQRQEISEKYLENIIKLLVRAKLLNGLRGKGGGYQLTRPPEEYPIGGILRLTEESLRRWPAWRRTRRPAPMYPSAAPWLFGRDWTRPSQSIWITLPWLT